MTPAFQTWCQSRFGFGRFGTWLWHPDGWLPSIAYPMPDGEWRATGRPGDEPLVRFTALTFPG